MKKFKLMNIIYDISVLGRGHRLSRSRTGVFRTVEEVALKLSRCGEVNLSFCAGECNFTDCQKFVDDNQVFAEVPFVRSENILARMRDYVSATAINGDERTISWLKNPILYKIFQSLKSYAPPLDKSSLRTSTIYHSPFDMVPLSILRNNKNLKLFLTIYDLIPLLYPNYFDTPQDTFQRQRISPLEHDGYFLCISAATKNDLCACFPRILPERVFVTHLAASEVFFRCEDPLTMMTVRRRYQIPDDVQYLLSVCTLEPRKNIAMTIRCFIRMVRQERLTDIALVLVGTHGWDYGDVMAEINLAQDLREKIILAGYVPDQDLAPLYSGATAFIYPSHYEGFGLPPLEAMQCGIPVITSNTSSLPEVVGDAGIMVDPNDNDALTQAMLEVCCNSSLRMKLSQKSLYQARQFSWDKTVDATVAAYRSALQR